MTDHTPAPWVAFIKGNTIAIGTGAIGKAVDAVVHWSGFDASHSELGEQKANARRIVFCVNEMAILENLARDPRVSSEALGMRIRNNLAR